MKIKTEADIIKQLIPQMDADSQYKAGLYNGIEWLMSNLEDRNAEFKEAKEFK